MMPHTSSLWDSKTEPTEAPRRGERAAVLAAGRRPWPLAAARGVVARGRVLAFGAGDRRVLEADRPEGRAPAGRRFVVTTMRTTVTAVPTAPEDRGRGRV